MYLTSRARALAVSISRKKKKKGEVGGGGALIEADKGQCAECEARGACPGEAVCI